MNPEVTKFLDDLHHPFRKEIEALRKIIMSSDNKLDENIKWNGPNYSFNGNDRITMKIQPPKVVQLIFHRGAAKQIQPKEKLIKEDHGLLEWKEDDRAVATFKTLADVENKSFALKDIIKAWLRESKM